MAVVENVVGQDAVVGQLDPGLLVAAVVVGLVAGLGPGVRGGVVDVRLWAVEVAGQDPAVGQHGGGVVAETGLREAGRAPPGIGRGVVNLGGMSPVRLPLGAGVFTAQDQDPAVGQHVG